MMHSQTMKLYSGFLQWLLLPLFLSLICHVGFADAPSASPFTLANLIAIQSPCNQVPNSEKARCWKQQADDMEALEKSQSFIMGCALHPNYQPLSFVNVKKLVKRFNQPQYQYMGVAEIFDSVFFGNRTEFLQYRKLFCSLVDRAYQHSDVPYAGDVCREQMTALYLISIQQDYGDLLTIGCPIYFQNPEQLKKNIQSFGKFYQDGEDPADGLANQHILITPEQAAQKLNRGNIQILTMPGDPNTCTPVDPTIDKKVLVFTNQQSSDMVNDIVAFEQDYCRYSSIPNCEDYFDAAFNKLADVFFGWADDSCVKPKINAATSILPPHITS